MVLQIDLLNDVPTRSLSAGVASLRGDAHRTIDALDAVASGG